MPLGSLPTDLGRDFGCPADIAIATAVQAIRDFLQQHECEMDVYLVVFDRESFQLSGRLFDDVKSYLDEHYVEEHLEKNIVGMTAGDACRSSCRLRSLATRG